MKSINCLISIAVCVVGASCTASLSVGEDGGAVPTPDGSVFGDAQEDPDASIPLSDAASGDASLATCPSASLTTACTQTTGRSTPRPTCSVAEPCYPKGVSGAEDPITTPITIPDACKTSNDRDSFDDGPPRTWTDSVSGELRAACIYRPTVPTVRPRPLVVYLHGTHGSAPSIYDTTSLRAKAEDFLLGTNLQGGFVLASFQSRNLQNPDHPSMSGAQHDFDYRDLNSPS